MVPPEVLIAELASRYVLGLAEVTSWCLAAIGLVVVIALTYRFPIRKYHRPIRWTLLTALVVLGICWGYSLLWMGDDAFISFRYARNLALGRGLVYNVGERVEGYTDFLWTVLLAAGIAIRQSPLLVSTVLGLASFGGIALICTRLVQRLAPAPGPVVLSAASVGVMGSYVMASFSTSGLETMFAAFLVLLALDLVLHDRLLAGGCAGIAAALTHPDHLLFYLALGAALVVDVRRVGVRRLARYALPLGAIYVPYFAWRWIYYRSFYPNTYYAKSADLWYFSQGAVYTVVTVFAAGLFAALPLAFVGAGFRRTTIAGRFFLIAAPLYTLYVAKVGGDFMLGRFFVPIIPLLLVFAECAVRDLFAERSARGKVYGWFALGGLLLSAIPVRLIHPGEKIWNLSDERTFYPMDAPTDAGMLSHYRDRAADLNRLVRNVGRPLTLASGNLGILGYYADIPVVDIFGLADFRVAHMPIRDRARPGHEKIARGPYFLDRAIDVSDDPIYPPPYSRWTELRIGTSLFYTGAFSPTWVKPLRRQRDVRLPPIEQELAIYDPVLQQKSPDELACDLWFFGQYYFSKNPGGPTERQLIDRVVAFVPGWRGLEELIVGTRTPTQFVSKPLFAFERNEHWRRNGLAFVNFPTRSIVPGQGFVFGQHGPFANSLDCPNLDVDTGELLSPEFTLDGDALTVSVGGGRQLDVEFVALEVEGREIVRSTGCEGEILGRRLWDTRAVRGKKGRIRVVDRSSGGWGHILVDDVVQWTRLTTASAAAP